MVLFGSNHYFIHADVFDLPYRAAEFIQSESKSVTQKKFKMVDMTECSLRVKGLWV